MQITNTLTARDREEWRAWLAAHHDTESEIWLVFYKKASGRPRLAYDDAVEEGLCFGWIDSIAKRMDDDRYAQKFTSRKDVKKWSASNIERARKLIEQGRMTEAGLAKIDPDILARDILGQDAAPREPAQKQALSRLVIPAFIKRGLMANGKAWENFQRLAPSYRRLYIRWIMDAKKEETRQKRLREAIGLLEQNKKLGLK